MASSLNPDSAELLRLFHDKPEWDDLLSTLRAMSPRQARQHQALVLAAVGLDNERFGLQAVTDLLDARPDWINAAEGVNSDGDSKTTALALAVRTLRLDIVDLLVTRGASPTLRNSRGMDALDEAIQILSNHRLQAAAVDAILDSNAFSARRKAEALNQAAEVGSLGGVRALLARGARFATFHREHLDASRFTALHTACLNQEILSGQRCPMVQAMLESDHGLAVIDQGWGQSAGSLGAPMHCAAYNDQVGVLGQLVEHGACVNPPLRLAAELPYTPLMAAAFHASNGAIVFLLSRGADPHAVDANGRNALHALASNDLEMEAQDEKNFLLPCLTALLDAGTDPFARDAEGLSPLDLAQQNGLEHMAATLQSLHLDQRLDAPAGKTAAARL